MNEGFLEKVTLTLELIVLTYRRLLTSCYPTTSRDLPNTHNHKCTSALIRIFIKMPLASNLTHVSKATSVYGQLLMDAMTYMTDQSSANKEAVQEGLCYLRQFLTCCACAGLLEEAMVSPVCGHHYCAPCQTSSPKLKILCRQCRERKHLIEEKQLRIIVACYKQICYVLATQHEVETIPPHKKVSESTHKAEDTSTSTPSLHAIDILTELVKEVTEGTELPRMILHQPIPTKFLARKATMGHGGPVTPSPSSSRVVVSQKSSKSVMVFNGEKSVKMKIETSTPRRTSKLSSYKRKSNSRLTNTVKKVCTESNNTEQNT